MPVPASFYMMILNNGLGSNSSRDHYVSWLPDDLTIKPRGNVIVPRKAAEVTFSKRKFLAVDT